MIIINIINNNHNLDSVTFWWLDNSPNLSFTLLALKFHLGSPMIIIATSQPFPIFLLLSNPHHNLGRYMFCIQILQLWQPRL